MLVAEPAAVERYGRLRQTTAGDDDDARIEALRGTASAVRRDIVTMIDRAQLGHIGGDFSVTDILVTLFGARARRRPAAAATARTATGSSSARATAPARCTPRSPHCGFFPRDGAATRSWRRCRALNGHPNRDEGARAWRPTPARSATASRSPSAARSPPSCAARRWRTFVVLGDGELQEGSNWEAAMTAAHYGLGSLTAVVDRNRLQQGARTEETKQPRAARRQVEQLRLGGARGRRPRPRRAARGVRARRRPAGPSCVIANTIKGKGVSFMEDRVEWHHKVPSAEQVEAALEELTR